MSFFGNDCLPSFDTIDRISIIVFEFLLKSDVRNSFLIIYCFCDFSSGYLAGSDKERAADVMTMWKDPTIKMIIANRGGYGCARILDLVTLLLFLSCDSSKSSADV